MSYNKTVKCFDLTINEDDPPLTTIVVPQEFSIITWYCPYSDPTEALDKDQIGVTFSDGSAGPIHISHITSPYWRKQAYSYLQYRLMQYMCKQTGGVQDHSDDEDYLE